MQKHGVPSRNAHLYSVPLSVSSRDKLVHFSNALALPSALVDGSGEAEETRDAARSIFWCVRIFPSASIYGNFNFNVLRYIYFMCMNGCLHVCICTICIPYAQGSQKRLSGPPGTRITNDSKTLFRRLELNLGLCKSKQCCKVLSHRSTLSYLYFAIKGKDAKKRMELGDAAQWVESFPRRREVQGLVLSTGYKARNECGGGRV